MAEIPIPWPLTAHPGRRPGEGQGDLVNCYGAKIGEQTIIRRVAGVEKILEIEDAAFTLPALPVSRTPRGIHALEQGILHVWDGALYFWESDGTSVIWNTSVGTLLTGSDRVTIAHNLRPTEPQIVIVTDAGKAMIVDPDFAAGPTTGTFSNYYTVDSDLGNEVTNPVGSVEYFSGYFVFVRADGNIVASDLQNTAINALSVALAEYSSDEPLRAINNGPTLLIFGRRTTEVWTDVGSSPFPFAKQTAVDVGLLGKWTVAGGANQWGNGVYFIASDYTVRFMDGYRPVVISNDAVAQDIYDYRDSPGSLTCTVYGWGPWAVFSITSPEWTWEYMVNTGNWHRRKSHQQVNSRIAYGAQFENNWYVQMWPPVDDRTQLDTALVSYTGPDTHGYLGKLDADIFIEPNGTTGLPLPVLVESAAMKEYPVNFRFPSVEVDVVVAVGSYVSSSFEPAVQVSWSHNGGATWADPLIRSIGKQGEYSKRVVVRNLGRSTHHGTRIRLALEDPVPFILMGGLAPRAQPSRPRGI